MRFKSSDLRFKIGGAVYAAFSLLVVGLPTTAAPLQPTTRTVWDGVYTVAQSDRGRAAYRMSCASCHGESLQGDLAPALSGPFWSIWEGRPVAELMKVIRTTMPADGPESLKPEEYAAIVAYLFNVNKFPAGETELPTDAAALEAIKITKGP
jgi:mono/diheme cytochrome c family protein